MIKFLFTGVQFKRKAYYCRTYSIKFLEMKFIATILTLTLLLVCADPARSSFLTLTNNFNMNTQVEPGELETVSHVDLQRYLGKWYDIAHFPQSFQNGCSQTTAEYSLNEDGSIQVVNTCIKDGKLKVSKGKAKVKDKETNAKLKVTFFWPFSGKYWIIDLAEDYSYAVVGHPNRKYLWILSRTKEIKPEIYAGILSRIEAKGYDLSKLEKTNHM